MKIKYRKARPQPKRIFWLDMDNCYACKNRNNCGNCKILKKQSAYEKECRNRKEKQKIKEGKYE